MTPLTYSIDAAADRLGYGFTVDWLKKHIAADAIPYTKSGEGSGRAGRISFTEAQLAEIVAMHEVRPEDRPSPSAPDEFKSIASRRRAS